MCLVSFKKTKMNEKIINTSFGTVRVFDYIIEINIDEGMIFTIEHVKIISELVEAYFPNKKFGYLSNRINDYSINLTPDLSKSFHSNLVATAVVCYSDSSFENAKFQKKFYKTRPLQIFKNHQEAVNWLKSHL